MEAVTREDVLAIIRSIVTDVDLKTVNSQENLSDQGVDSLDMMNIIFAFQDRFGVVVTDESISRGEWLSVDCMVESLNRALAPPQA